jgi:hypothetical protein
MNPKRTNGAQSYVKLRWYVPVALGQGRCLLSSTRPLLIMDPGADVWLPSSTASIHGPFGLDPSMCSMVIMFRSQRAKAWACTSDRSGPQQVHMFVLVTPAAARTGRHVVHVGGGPLVSTFRTGNGEEAFDYTCLNV